MSYYYIGTWADAILAKSYTNLQTKPVRILVLVNPVSGSGSAVNIFNKEILQILKDSQCEVKTVITERANQAKELVHQLDPTTVDMILSVGGDGLFYEIIQGIMTREDKDVFLGTVTVVPIPGGTGNGLGNT